MKVTLHLSLVSIAIAVSILSPLSSFAQPPTSQEWTAMINSLSGKQEISAQAASFQKFGSYSVSLATGVPDVSIPIYTIKSGELEFPITLSYHMGGIKVEEIPTWVGLGWNLSAGGAINRIIRGNPDESYNGWLQENTSTGYSKYHSPLVKDDGIDTDRYRGYDDYTELINSTGFENAVQYYSHLSTDYNDKASDIYTYSINGMSGKFVYDFDRNIVQIPYTDNKIERNASTNDFSITDDKGNRYIFKISDAEYGEGPSVNRPWVPVTWLLSEIVSADGKDTIKFNYGEPVQYHTVTGQGSIIWGGYWDSNILQQTDKVYSRNTSLSLSRIQEKLLSSIEFKNGRVNFILDGQRLDMRNYSLSKIQVKDATGRLVKQAEFSYDYFGSGSEKYQKRLKLLGIKISGSPGSHGEPYTFTYNTTSLPWYCQIGVNNSGYRGQDYWGYYTGANNNGSMIPSELLAGISLSGGANRNSNEMYMKACVLNRIDYPTGGYSIFETEANRAKINGVGAEKPVGGLRIASIKSYTSSSDVNPLIISYSYEDGKLVYFPDSSLFMIDISFSAGATPGTPIAGAPFQAAYGYPIAPGIIFLENPISPFGYHQGSPVIYGKVTERQGGATETAGKTVYEFNAPSIFFRSISGYYTGMPHDGSATSVDWQNGHLKKMTVYRRENNGTDIKIKEIEHLYTGRATELCHGIMILDRVIYQGMIGNIGISAGSIEDTGIHASQYYYHYWTTEMTGWHKLASTTEKEFNSATDSIGTGTITTYTYDNTNLIGQQKNYLLSKMVIKDLHGELLNQKDYTYAHKAGSAATAMYSKNMLNYPYEETVTGRDGIIVFKSRIEYDIAMLRPSKIYRGFSSETPLLELTIMNRDIYGNVVETKDKAGVSTVCLWGYKGQYPVIEIVNATYQQVSNILGTTVINQILTSAQPTISQFSNLNALRSHNSLSDALVTTWEFSPLVGVTKITDHSGRVTDYIYNLSNRLSEIRDDKGYLMQSFQYQMTR